MSTDNTVADRLLTEARRRTARQENPALGTAALVVGILALLASPVAVAGWIGGGLAIALGLAALQRPAAARRGKLGIWLGVAALLVGVFFFNLSIAMGWG
ncbi:MAG TPA: hypothetical protein VM367_07995 [Pseudonocardia sp.]|jgi:hypothetical protein|nr:hypothetical protein [Pseudonocardia sp.]